MTYFINLRSHPVGGWLDTAEPPKVQESPAPTTASFDKPSVATSDFKSALQGKHVLFGTHGFNVDFVAGVSALSSWADLLSLPSTAIFVAILWPGDSVWEHGLDYPEEPRVADDAGKRLATFLDLVAQDAASISFVSHSLGARLVLQTVNQISRPVRRVILMAGAIDDTCLTAEFKTAANQIEKISVLASKHDEVLALAFPFGNLLGGILDQGHPWWRGALGRYGPSWPRCANFYSPFQIPGNWGYGHHDYLQSEPQYTGVPMRDIDVPSEGSPIPSSGPGVLPSRGWQQAWSAAFTCTRFL